MIKTEGDKIVSISGRPGAGVSELSKYFGKRPGESLSDFAKELKALTLDDRVQLVGGIVDGTLNYDFYYLLPL